MNKCNYCVNVAQDTTDKVASCNICDEDGNMYEYDFENAGNVFEELIKTQEKFVEEFYK